MRTMGVSAIMDAAEILRKFLMSRRGTAHEAATDTGFTPDGTGTDDNTAHR